MGKNHKRANNRRSELEEIKLEVTKLFEAVLHLGNEATEKKIQAVYFASRSANMALCGYLLGCPKTNDNRPIMDRYERRVYKVYNDISREFTKFLRAGVKRH